jgi:Mg-chelatase subunit ChlD
MKTISVRSFLELRVGRQPSFRHPERSEEPLTSLRLLLHRTECQPGHASDAADDRKRSEILRYAQDDGVWGALARAILRLALLLVTILPLRAQDDALTRERDEQTGTAITILFDNSGSMRGDKLKQAKRAFRAWLQTVPADYKFSLITFEENGRLTIPLGERTRDLVAERVAKLEARTSTPICGALRIAREQIEKRRREVTPYERHVVVVFTDGQETGDPRGARGVQEDITALRKQTVEVVGVGFHGQGDYMSGVATRFALANNEQELKQGLAKVDAEIGGVDDLVVTEADLTALGKYDAPPVQPIAATAEPVTESSTTTPAEPFAPSAPGQIAPKKGLPFGWIATAIVVWLVLRGFTKPKKTKR